MKFCIIGTGRCGTGMLSSLLNAHPEVYVFRETHWIPKMWEWFGTGPASFEELAGIVLRTRFVDGEPTVTFDEKDVLRRLQGRTIDVVSFSEALAESLASREGKRIWGDKTPDYGPYMSLLQALWPACRFLHLIRHPFDVVRSMQAHPGYRWLVAAGEDYWVQPSFNDYHRQHSATAGVDRDRLVQLWRRRLLRIRDESTRLVAGSYRELRYEDFLTDPRAAMLEVASFLELDGVRPWIRRSASRVQARRWQRRIRSSRGFDSDDLRLVRRLGYSTDVE